ncbi:DUF7096 domain-containing protein [Haloarchaeobius sp. HRN-SO-5]|uniref:DUF7096 domain-containing protein n=1 Tax=Haloarchaeobius sp. HRN-SO-5 TaxID=3446118 RepID=UPI003EBCC08A
MSRLTLLVLMALLTASPAASVAGTGVDAPPSDPSTVEAASTQAVDAAVANNTTRRLRLDSVGRQNYSQPGMDFGSTVAMTGQRLEHGFNFEHLSVQVQQAASPQAQQALVDSEVDQIRRGIDDMRSRERDAILAYGNGEITDEQLARRLAMVHARAVHLDEAISRIENGYGVELGTLHRRTNEYRTPIRSQVLDAIEGDREDPVMVHVAGSGQGVVLQSISESQFDSQYYREAVRIDNFDTDPSDGFNSSSFLAFVSEQYPFIETENGGTLRPTGTGNWFYDKTSDWGSIRVYADGSTQSVYREYQTLRMSDLPTSTVHNETGNATTVSLSETANDGPAQLVVTDALTGDPVTASVYVDGELVGRTDGAGSLWILQPAGEYEVSVRTQDGPVNVSVSP